MLRAEYDLLMALARLATRNEQGSRFDVTMRLSEVFEAARALEEKMVGRPFDDDLPVKAAPAGNGNMTLRPSCFGHPETVKLTSGMIPCPGCLHEAECCGASPRKWTPYSLNPGNIATTWTTKGEVVNVEKVVMERNALRADVARLKEENRSLLDRLATALRKDVGQ